MYWKEEKLIQIVFHPIVLSQCNQTDLKELWFRSEKWPSLGSNYLGKSQGQVIWWHAMAKKMKPRNINHYGGYHKNWPLFLFESWLFCESYSPVFRWFYSPQRISMKLRSYGLKMLTGSSNILWFLSVVVLFVRNNQIELKIHNFRKKRNSEFVDGSGEQIGSKI